jgi:hypothetical protein
MTQLTYPTDQIRDLHHVIDVSGDSFGVDSLGGKQGAGDETPDCAFCSAAGAAACALAQAGRRSFAAREKTYPQWIRRKRLRSCSATLPQFARTAPYDAVNRYFAAYADFSYPTVIRNDQRA